MNFDFDTCFWRRYWFASLDIEDILNLIITSKIFYKDKNYFYRLIFSKIQYNVLTISRNLSLNCIGFQNRIQRSLDIEDLIKITDICKSNLYIKKFMSRKYMNSRYHIYFRKYFIDCKKINNEQKEMDLFVSNFIDDRNKVIDF